MVAGASAGTSKGIGYDAALLLARAGHEVVATMRHPGASDLGTVASAAKLPLTVVALDVDDDASVAGVFAALGDSIDVLVNNAGILSLNAVEDESLEQYRRVMETNYFGAMRCIKQVLPAMRRRGSGHIINISSIAGRVGFFAESAYSASKFALEGFSEALAQEVKGSASASRWWSRVSSTPPWPPPAGRAPTSVPCIRPPAASPCATVGQRKARCASLEHRSCQGGWAT
ncbi:MAG: SDR family NAD(P)-dependent oxidoreductase [Myxococcota bacterium]